MEPDIAEVLKAARAKKNLTQQQVADTLKVSRAAVGQWESGATKPSYVNLVQLFDLYDLMPDRKSGDGYYGPEEREKIAHTLSLRTPVKAPNAAYDVPVKMMVVGEFGLCVETPKPLFSVFRPPIEGDQRELFAIQIFEETLWPRYERGDILYVDAKAPLTTGCYAVLSFLLVDNMPLLPPAPYLRRVSNLLDDLVEVEQFQPANRKLLKQGDFQVVGRVLHPSELYPFR